MKNLVFTFGLAMFDQAQFDAAIEVIAPDILIDARVSPGGRAKHGLGNRQIESRFPDIYQWRGNELGGATRMGVPYAMTPQGLERLAKDAQSKTIALFCQCHDAVHRTGMACHRHDIAVKLHDRVNFANIQWSDQTKTQLWWVPSREDEKYRQHIKAGGNPEKFEVHRYLFPQEMPIESDFAQ